MKAKLLPLDGKYYSTQIDVEHNGRHLSIDIGGGGLIPSEREDITEEDIAETGENHYESELAYRTAKFIVDKINEVG